MQKLQDEVEKIRIENDKKGQIPLPPPPWASSLISRMGREW